MLENARRQVVLVLLVIAAAIACYLLKSPHLGSDLKGGVQILYEVPRSAIDKIIAADKTQTLDKVMDSTISVMTERADPNGTIAPLVSRRGETGIIIELGSMSASELALMKARIESLGKLEMRIVAEGSFEKDSVKFDIPAEKKKLEEWLKNGGKDLLKQSYKNIDSFNSLSPEQGGPVAGSANLNWFVRFIEPRLTNAKFWSPSYAQMGSELGQSTVMAFDQNSPTEWNGGTVPEALQSGKDKPRLIELIAINMKEQFFKGEDLEPSGVHAGMSSDGTPSVNYKIKDARSGDYAEWSQKWIKHHSAIILNNVVKSAPVFQSRIPGSGEIHGDFTQAEVEELVKVLRTGSLRVEPQFESLSQIGATLGQDSIRRGVTSLLAGSLAVFAFMLVYYRLSGLVACITLLLNVALLYAAMLFTESTITLPGLGGIVLTMGMAVDANILIYERIREEIDRGKDLLRATRAGFERAMVVILDANLTTFLSGLVLYDVGVGPVRGFAVTLMWGIVTTLFTQFFVTRLLFHFLIDRKILTEYRMKRWLTGFNVDFVRYIKGWLVLSGAVIVFGIVYAGFVVPTDKLLGMDFTGGANLQMALEQPTGAEVIRTELAKDPGFHSRFPNPTVNTIGEVADNKATHFNIRVKLDEALRHQIEQERRDYSQRKLDAAAKGEPLPPPYEPPYLVDLRRIFAGQLVQPAYSDATVATLPNGMGAASIVLHFQKPVAIAEVKRVLEEAKFPPPSVTGKDGETVVETKDVWVQWTTTANTLPSQLFERVRDPLIAQKDKDGPTALKDTAGKSIELSDPFPEAAEMAGRIVSELRNAAIGALILAWVMILFYLRVRFHEYKFGIAAIVALLHDVSVTFAVVVVANHLGLVHAELDLNMIACFLTIIGYSVNDTIVVFDRIRENIQEQARTGEREPFPHLINRSINQTLSRTVLTSGVTMFCVLAQFLVNWGSDSDLESFAFAMTFGIITGTYSSIYIAAPILIMMRGHELAGGSHPGPTGDQPATPVPVQTAG